MSRMVLFPWCFLVGLYAFYYEGFDFIGDDIVLSAGIVKKCAVIEYPKSEIGIYQAA